MARIRSVHPGLFTDEAFVSVSMAARVLLPGIWTEADDHGVFEWKPRTLKMKIFPADNVDVDALLAELIAADAVQMFTCDGKEYGAVRNFGKYQRPKKPVYRHPFPDELRTYVHSKDASSEPVPHQSPTGTEKPKQRKEEGGNRRKKDIRAVADATRPFDDFWKAYPRRDGANPKTPAKKKFDALVKSGVDPGEIITAASRYAAEMRAKGQERTPYVAQAMTWLNQQRHGDYGEPEPEQPADAPGFYAAFSSPQLEAWDEYERQIGKRKPRDKAGGWRYETEWPPGIGAVGDRTAVATGENPS